jgi:hypothetical protein
VLYQLSYASGCSLIHSFFAAHLSHTREAGDGARTRDIKLGRLALYQLSYSRGTTTTVVPDLPDPPWWGKDSNLRRREPADLQSAPVGRLGTPPRLTSPHANAALVGRADGETRTRNLLITNQLLCQLSYVGTQRFCARLVEYAVSQRVSSRCPVRAWAIGTGSQTRAEAPPIARPGHPIGAEIRRDATASSLGNTRSAHVPRTFRARPVDGPYTACVPPVHLRHHRSAAPVATTGLTGPIPRATALLVPGG